MIGLAGPSRNTAPVTMALRRRYLVTAMHFTPTGSSWINHVERWFGLLTEQLIRRGVHQSLVALENNVRQWIKNWNDNPKPFEWNKTADDILQSLSKYILKISDAGH
jgi:hypothetical protein